MKKSLLAVGLIATLLFLTGKLKAALPLDLNGQSRTTYVLSQTTTSPSYFNTYPAAPNFNLTFSSVSAPASGSAALIVLPVVQSTQPVGNNALAASTYTARNCLTDVTASLSFGSTMYIYDGALNAATTSYVIYGASLFTSSSTATNVVGLWQKHWDHNGPFCGTAGNTLTISIPAPSGATSNNAVGVEGFSLYTGMASNLNSGQ